MSPAAISTTAHVSVVEALRIMAKRFDSTTPPGPPGHYEEVGTP